MLSTETLADIIPSFAENASIDGVQYGIPFIASSRALFYNTVLFEEAGIEGPPETWQELRDAAQAITDAGHIGYAMPLGPEEAQAESAIWMYGNGGGWVDEEGNFAIDQEANVEAFEFMTALVSDGLTQPSPATTDRADALNLFYEGEVGMIEGLVQTPVTIAADYPDLEYAVAASPHNEGAEPAALGVADHFMVFNNEGNEAAAGAFLDFFYQADNYSSFIVSEGFLPVTTSGGEAAMPEFPEELTPFIEALPGARFYPSSNPAWGGVQGYVQQNIGLAVEGDDPASVLADVQAEAEALAEEAAGYPRPAFRIRRWRPPETASRRRPSVGRLLSRQAAPLPWVLPCLALISVVVLRPIYVLFSTSRRDLSGSGRDRGPAGWDNFRELFSDRYDLVPIVVRTAVWVVVVVAVTVLVVVAAGPVPRQDRSRAGDLSATP